MVPIKLQNITEIYGLFTHVKRPASHFPTILTRVVNDSRTSDSDSNSDFKIFVFKS